MTPLRLKLARILKKFVPNRTATADNAQEFSVCAYAHVSPFCRIIKAGNAAQRSDRFVRRILSWIEPVAPALPALPACISD